MNQQDHRHLKNQISDLILEVVNLFDDVTTSDLQGIADVKSTEIIKLCLGKDSGSPSFDMKMEISNLILEVADQCSEVTPGDLQGIAEVKAANIISLCLGDDSASPSIMKLK